MNFVAQGFVDNGYFIRESDTQGDFRFDGLGKRVFVNEGVTSMTIAGLYSRWMDWAAQDDNLKFDQAMRFSGYDPIPGGFTGTTFFMSNGWRLVYDPNVVAVSGVLYSENEATAYWNAAGNPIYPATVSSLVNSSVSYANVVTGTALTAEQTANAVWQAVSRSLTTGVEVTGSTAPSASEVATAVWQQNTRTLTSANVSITPAEIWNYVNRTLTSGSSLAPTALENAAAVREALAIELAMLDAAVSTRIATGTVVKANVLAIKDRSVSGDGTKENPWRPA